MTFATKANLKTNVLDYMARNELTGNVDDFITLAEARLNRELEAVEVDTTLTGVVDSRSIDISSLSMVEPIALFLAEVGCDEVMLTPKVDGTFPYIDSSGRPRYWAIDGDNIDFDRPLDGAYPFRFRYRERFSLASDGSTNWLLTNYPDVYLAAVVTWGFIFLLAPEKTAFYKAILDDALPSVKHIIARKKRAVLTTDPMLQRIGHRVWGNDWVNQ
jgi:hypothetical protein